ncbi:MAG: hypothetical protein KBT48_01065, partial [Firmicutes bacterium]|nr:hypothetical protein [Bacillota bacterium]
MKRIPGYSIVSRAIVYCARILSLQYGKEYTRKQYGEVKKVISFWIMPQSAQYLDGVVEITRLVKDSPRKRRIEEKEAYDKICIVEMYISKDHDIQKKYEKYDEVLTPLFVLLTNKLSIQDKKRILKEYGFKVDEDLERSLDTMCNLSVGIREEGRCEG